MNNSVWQRFSFCVCSCVYSLTGLSPVNGPSSSPAQATIKTVPYAPPALTPRPALTPSSTHCHTSMQCHSKLPERIPLSSPCSSSLPTLNHRAKAKEPSQSGVDSSGYSSSEGPYRKPLPATSTPKTTSSSSSSGATGPEYKRRIRDAFNNLMGEDYFLCVCMGVLS